jgi:hypothetical protein
VCFLSIAACGKSAERVDGVAIATSSAATPAAFEPHVAATTFPPDAAPAEIPITAPIRNAWLAAGGAAFLGRPFEPAREGPGGLVQRFERGCVAPDGSGRWEAFDACDPPPDLGPLLDSMGARIAKMSFGTDAAIGVTWLPTGQRWTYRGEVPRVAASAGKFVWALAALHAGRVSLDELDPIAHRAFHYSDNVAGRELIDLAGGPNAVNDFTTQVLGIPIERLGLCSYSADHLRRASNCWAGANMNNYFTAAGGITFLEHVFRGDVVSPEARDRLLGWSRLSPPFGFSIGKQLPALAAATMHHKRSELPQDCCDLPKTDNWTAELAIIHTPRGPYAFAISLAHSETYANQIGAIVWASCVVYHALARDVVDAFDAGCVHP